MNDQATPLQEHADPARRAVKDTAVMVSQILHRN